MIRATAAMMMVVSTTGMMPPSGRLQKRLHKRMLRSLRRRLPGVSIEGDVVEDDMARIIFRHDMKIKQMVSKMTTVKEFQEGVEMLVWNHEAADMRGYSWLSVSILAASDKYFIPFQDREFMTKLQTNLLSADIVGGYHFYNEEDDRIEQDDEADQYRRRATPEAEEYQEWKNNVEAVDNNKRFIYEDPKRVWNMQLQYREKGTSKWENYSPECGIGAESVCKNGQIYESAEGSNGQIYQFRRVYSDGYIKHHYQLDEDNIFDLDEDEPIPDSKKEKILPALEDLRNNFVMLLNVTIKNGIHAKKTVQRVLVEKAFPENIKGLKASGFKSSMMRKCWKCEEFCQIVDKESKKNSDLCNALADWKKSYGVDKVDNWDNLLHYNRHLFAELKDTKKALQKEIMHNAGNSNLFQENKLQSVMRELKDKKKVIQYNELKKADAQKIANSESSKDHFRENLEDEYGFTMDALGVLRKLKYIY